MILLLHGIKQTATRAQQNRRYSRGRSTMAAADWRWCGTGAAPGRSLGSAAPVQSCPPSQSNSTAGAAGSGRGAVDRPSRAFQRRYRRSDAASTAPRSFLLSCSMTEENSAFRRQRVDQHSALGAALSLSLLLHLSDSRKQTHTPVTVRCPPSALRKKHREIQ